MSRVSAVVLAGVHRWDESEFDRLMPRPLMPIAHTPLICHVLRWIQDGGIDHVAICANSASRLVRQALGDGRGFGLDLDYFEDWSPRGPAGCVRDAVAPFGPRRLVVADGTILPESGLRGLLAAHERSGARATVVVAQDGSGANAGQRLAPVGIYVLEPEVLSEIPDTGYQDLKEGLLPRLYEKRAVVNTYSLPAPCPRLSDVSSYLALSARALERLLEHEAAPPGYRRCGMAIIHQSARVLSPDRVVGPALIGPRSVVAENATLVGPVTIGADGVIAPNAVVCRAVLWDRCQVGPRSIVDHCVLSDGVQVEQDASLFYSVRSAVAPPKGFWEGPEEAAPITEDAPSRIWDLSAEGQARVAEARS